VIGEASSPSTHNPESLSVPSFTDSLNSENGGILLGLTAISINANGRAVDLYRNHRLF